MNDDDEDDHAAILSRRELLIATALSGAARAAPASAQPDYDPLPCLSSVPCLVPPPPPPEVSFSTAPGRILSPYDRLPATRRRHASGIFAAGEGPGRSLGTSRSASTAAAVIAGAERRLPLRWSALLTTETMRELVALADRAWREPRRPPRRASSEYDEVRALWDADGSTFVLQGAGRIVGGAAGDLITRLRSIAEEPGRGRDSSSLARLGVSRRCQSEAGG